MKGQDTRLGVPAKGDVLAYSAAQDRWVKVNVKYVRANPSVYPRWVACKDVSRTTETVDAAEEGKP